MSIRENEIKMRGSGETEKIDKPKKERESNR